MTLSIRRRPCKSLRFSSAGAVLAILVASGVQFRWRTQANATATNHRDGPAVWTCGADRGGEQQLFGGDRQFGDALSEQSGYAIWIGHTVFRGHSSFAWQLLYAHHRPDRQQ